MNDLEHLLSCENDEGDQDEEDSSENSLEHSQSLGLLNTNTYQLDSKPDVVANQLNQVNEEQVSYYYNNSTLASSSSIDYYGTNDTANKNMQYYNYNNTYLGRIIIKNRQILKINWIK